jgi:hypothetical protein
VDERDPAGTSVENLLLRSFREERPAVLFLGQDAWCAGPDRTDPVLATLADRIGYADVASSGWAGLLASSRLSDDKMKWLTERFERNVFSHMLSSVLELPWSAVFTTSIDPSLRTRLEANGREPELIASSEYFPAVARSRVRPPVTHLFGVSNGQASRDFAPRDQKELRRRSNAQALSLAARMLESATQLGLIVIDGFTPDRDWMSPDDLFSMLPPESAPRIIWFGARPEWVPQSAVELLDSHNLQLEPRPLSEVLLGMLADGRLDSASIPTPLEPGVLRLAEGARLVLGPALRLRVEASAAVVDDDWYASPSNEVLRESDAFERFHGDLAGRRGLVQGVARGFAIEREFEGALRKRVDAALRRQDDLDRIVLVHGQSATGKSIALARLAITIRRELSLPVLYARHRMPQLQDVLPFAEAAEAAGASAVVVLADCNQPPERYRDLASGLRAKGRRVVIVGTSYRQDVRRRSVTDFIEAPSKLTVAEQAALRTLLESAGVAGAAAGAASVSHEQNALAWLYRHLSAGREAIISSIARETRVQEEIMRQRARSIRTTEARSVLAEQLIAAGLHNGRSSLFDEPGGLDEFGGDAAGRLIDLVMVCGRLGTPVPLNLLLRVVGSSHKLDVLQTAHLFEDLDIFRWEFADEQQSELKVLPRIQLEADLICRRRLPDIRGEIDRLVDLIRGLSSASLERRIEVDFLRDLLQRLDSRGPRGDAYASGYLQFARALTELRVRHHVRDASLMLQESAFRRAALRMHDRQGRSEFDATTRAQVLNEARGVVEEALTAITDGSLRAAYRTRENLQVERAAIYGFLAVGRAKAREAGPEIWSDYQAARVASRAAIGATESYFPLDVALWTPADLLLEGQRSGVSLTEAQRAELVADIQEVLDQVDPGSLPPEQEATFQKQRVKVAQALQDNRMTEQALRRLEEINPQAAFYLRARTLAANALQPSDGNVFDSARRAAAGSGATFLESRLAMISDDSRCLELLLTLRWLEATGRRPLRGLRQPLPEALARRADIASVVDQLVELGGTGVRFALRHLQAALLWVRGEHRRADELWRTLSRDTEAEDRTRTTRRQFLSDDGGAPRWFRGQVVERRTRGHWWLAVQGLDARIALLEDEFKGQEIAIGREVRRFAIAFNYIGPIADPAYRYEVER